MNIDNRKALRRAFYIGLGCVCFTASRAEEAAVTPAKDAAAQTATPKEEDPNQIIQMEDMVVTAVKEARPLKEVPMSVAAVTGVQLESVNLLDAKEVVKLVPGLSINTTDPALPPVPAIRGVAFETRSQAAPTVDFYWNEIPIDANKAFRAVYDIAQMEVLRGPQGTLRGKASPGGAMTFTTKKPNLNEYSSSVDLTWTDLGGRNAQASANVPIIKGKLAVRIAGLYDFNHGAGVRNVTTGELGWSYTRSGRASVEFSPWNTVKIDYVFQKFNSERAENQLLYGAPGYPNQGPVINVFDRLAVTPTDPRYKDVFNMHMLDVSVKTPARTELKVLASYITSTSSSVNEVNFLNLIPNWNHLSKRDGDTRDRTFEAKWGSVGHDFWNYDIGFFYTDTNGVNGMTGSASQLWLFPGASPSKPFMDIPLTVDVKSNGTNRAFYTSHSIKFTESLKLELGLRHQEYYTNTYTLGKITTGSTPTTIINDPQILTDKANTYSVSLNYKLNRRINYYASLRSSFRPSGAQVRTNAYRDQDLLNWKAEKSNGVEIGTKCSFFNNALQVNADVFYQKFTNYISAATGVAASNFKDGLVNGTMSITVNGDAEIKGAELSANWSLPHRFVVGGDVSATDPKWTKVSMPATVLNAAGQPVIPVGQQVAYVDFSGKELPGTSKVDGNIHASWSKPLAGKSELFVRSMLRYTGRRSLTGGDAAGGYVGGYATLDLSGGVRLSSHWTITVWSKNLLDRKAMTDNTPPSVLSAPSAINGVKAAVWNNGYRIASLQAAREIGVNLSLKF